MSDGPQSKLDSSAEWERQEQIISRFEDAWQRGEQPVLESYLSTDSGSRQSLLSELAAIDLEYRLKTGRLTFVEEYLQRFPELTSDTEPLLQLAEIEFRIRRRSEPELNPAQVADRFPEHRQPLLDRLQRLASSPSPDETVRWPAPDVEQPTPGGNSEWEATQRDNRPGGPRMADGPQALGKFLLHERLGQGGFGAVYRAYDTQLERMVAIKIPHAQGLSAGERDRFLAEARNAARLRHAGIVPVYEVGHENETPYIVSEFVHGETLGAHRAQLKLQWRRSAELIAGVADALHYAHSEGVVHRDVKPSNILVALDGTPRLMDFGLAKHLASNELLTTEGDVLGTPAYMSPEQAAGHGNRADGRCDVYSLGVVLYELLTGELPFRGHPRMVMQQVLNEEPVRPRLLNDLAPRDLETICLKAMAKEPARRYATAGEMAADLRRYLGGEPIHARPIRRAERLWRWCRRNPRVAGLTTAVAVLLITVAVGSTIAAVLLAQFAHSEQLAAQAALAAQTRAERAENEEREAAHRARAEAATTQQVVQFLTNMFTESDPIALERLDPRKGVGFGAQLTALQLLQRARQRIDQHLGGEPTVRAALLDSIGNVYRGLGLYEESAPLLEEALALRIDIHGPLSSEAATTMHHLGFLRQMQGEFDEAANLYDQALKAKEQQFGSRSLEAADVRFNIAWLQAERANFDDNIKPGLRQATELMADVLRIRRSILGEKHRQVALTRIALSWMQFADEQRLEAIANAGQALTILEAEAGPQEVPSIVVSYMQSVAARRRKEPAKAMQLARQVLQSTQRLLGENHPISGMLMGDMAGIANEMGDLAEAERLIRRALDIGRTIPGGHPLMVDALLRLGDVVRDRCDLVEAAMLYAEALTMGRRLLGPTHRTVLQLQERLDSLPKPQEP